MATEIEIYRQIEEIVGSYGARQLDLIFGHNAMTADEVFTIRGKAQATNELIKQLRNHLGYRPDSL